MTREESLTIACVSWFKLQYPDRVIIHIANERSTSPQRGAKLKKMGVMPGVSDLFIPEGECSHYYGDSSGVWIELKVKGNYPTATQRKFLLGMKERGFTIAVVWTIDEFMRYIEQYFTIGKIDCPYIAKLIGEEV